MKRFFVTAVVCISLLIMFPTRSVVAASPTPTQPPIPEGRAINAGVLNTLLEKGQSIQGGTEPVSSINFPSVNLEANNDFDVSNLQPVSDLFKATVPFLDPYLAKQITKDQDANLYISGKATHCVYGSDGSFRQESSEKPYITEIIPELSDLDQSSRQIASHLTQYSFSKTDGSYNFKRSPLVLADPPGCDETDIGTVQQPKTVQLAQGMNIIQLVLNFLRTLFSGDSLNIRETFASKQLTPYAESMGCLISGCQGGTLSYLEKKEQERVQKSGGVAKTYAPMIHDVTKGEVHGEQENTFGGTGAIQTHVTESKAIENAKDYILCSILPKSERDKYGLAGKCEQETTSCDVTLPKLPANQSCKLKNNTLKLPKNLVTAIEAAASAYKVPASLIVGVIYGEGGFNPGSIYLNEAQVEKYLKGCATLPNCSPKATIIKNIVEFYQVNWNDLSNAVNIIDPKRKPNACNLLDGIFALAKDLSQNQYGSAAFAGKTCFGIKLNAGSGGSASCNWSDTSAETAIRVWEFGVEWNNATLSCATKLNSCLMGGGLDAQCPTGGDTCETGSNRYTQPSHNACIWNVYKSN